jgi:hypothetical protein
VDGKEGEREGRNGEMLSEWEADDGEVRCAAVDQLGGRGVTGLGISGLLTSESTGWKKGDEDGWWMEHGWEDVGH